MPDAVKTRRFPPPWVIEDHNNTCFIVKDGFAVAYVYFSNRPVRVNCNSDCPRQ